MSRDDYFALLDRTYPQSTVASAAPKCLLSRRNGSVNTLNKNELRYIYSFEGDKAITATVYVFYGKWED